MERRVQELDDARARNPDAYTRHDNWIKMRQEVWNVHHAGEPLPEQAGGQSHLFFGLCFVCLLLARSLRVVL